MSLVCTLMGYSSRVFFFHCFVKQFITEPLCREWAALFGDQELTRIGNFTQNKGGLQYILVALLLHERFSGSYGLEEQLL